MKFRSVHELEEQNRRQVLNQGQASEPIKVKTNLSWI
jgi:hypothetical protein